MISSRSDHISDHKQIFSLSFFHFRTAPYFSHSRDILLFSSDAYDTAFYPLMQYRTGPKSRFCQYGRETDPDLLDFHDCV